MGRGIDNIGSVYNKIPDSIKGFFELGSNAITVMTALGSSAYVGFNFVKGIKTGQPVTDIPWKSLIIVVLIVTCVTMLIRLKNSKANLMKERSVVSEKYYFFMHDYRNTINQLECCYKTSNLNIESLTETVEYFWEKSLEYLSETLTVMTGQIVSSCVKSIVGGGFERIAYKDANVKTFVRSRNMHVRRHIVGGVNGTLFSVLLPPRPRSLVGDRRLSAEQPHTVVALFERQASCF